MSLQIPQYYRSPLKLLGRLDSAIISSLSEQLSNVEPTFDIEGLATQLASETLPEAELHELLSLLISLFKVIDASDLGLDELVADICEEASGFLVADEDSGKLRTNLNALLINDSSIGVAAKAIDVFTEHERGFRDCRILTDLRPVFSSSDDEEIVAAMATHMLKLEYSESGQRKDFFVAMDSNDINRLIKTLERALVKEIAIRELTDKNKIVYMDVTDLEDI